MKRGVTDAAGGVIAAATRVHVHHGLRRRRREMSATGTPTMEYGNFTAVREMSSTGTPSSPGRQSSHAPSSCRHSSTAGVLPFQL
jgi:hypothetical protein